ncbi:AraC family transcriptional regulator [Aporhodopirellula aestuarii]|uniref:AraC family transcriptional regulator n=1 Tax=Aporhodopirellula aestuarii TaxID=2950107 RepID=A0ABT0UCX5_9BACT|nr:AraC family transcriptional regulator [Aporhodopirellula aestuarii]MCM2374775.1 AraC family transcriptional regulator [Aporhodopirellula aestuarii]
MNSSVASTFENVPNEVRSIDIRLLVQLFEQAPDVAFFVKDAEGRYLAVNRSLADRHGLKNCEDAIGKRPVDICVGRFGLVPTDQDAKLLRSGRPLVDLLEMHWHLPHEPVWCLTTKLPIMDEDGKVVGIVGFSRDVRAPVENHEIPEEFASALRYFEQNLTEFYTPSALAERSNMSLQRLSRLTKRLFGLTPSQFISKTRIALASRLLYETDQPISEIALTSGFYDQSAFTRAFRVATGVTPSEFRRQAKQIDGPNG